MNLNSNIRSHEPITLEGDFTMKVLGFVALAFAFSAIGVKMSSQIIPEGFPLMILYIVELVIILLARWWTDLPRPLNFLIFYGFAFLTGVTLAPLLTYSLAIGGTELVYSALIATVALTIGAALFAKTTNKDLSGWGGFLLLAVLGLIVVGILQIFFFSSIVELISAGIGILVFSAFIAYDFYMMKHHPRDRALEAAIGLYLSIFNLFTSALRFMGAISGE